MTGWQPSKTAPKDGTTVLLLTAIGVVSGWYSPGQWSEATPDHPSEYDGAVWVCYDDKFQIEIEETPEGDFSEVTHWQPMLDRPAATPAPAEDPK